MRRLRLVHRRHGACAEQRPTPTRHHRAHADAFAQRGTADAFKTRAILNYITSPSARALAPPRARPPLGGPRAYLPTLAKGVVSEHWRRQALERAYIEALALSPEERLQLLQTLDAIDAMLDGLPHKAREAFVLSQLEGLTYAQIAQRLAISERTVKHHMALGFEHCLALVE